MARQISMEAGIEAYRKKCADLLHQNVLLEAANAELEAELASQRAATGGQPGAEQGATDYPQTTSVN
jgi:hypothetical protein